VSLTEPSSPPASPPAAGQLGGGARGTPVRRPQALRWGRDLWPPVLMVLVLLGLWQLASTVLAVDDLLLPTPGAVADEFVRNFSFLLENGVVTATAAYLAFGLSIAVGVPIGVLAVKSRFFAHVIYPFIVGSQAVPKLALTPLFAVWLGFGITSKVAMGLLIAFFPVAISTAVGMASVDRDTRQLARALGLGRLRTFARIELPSALPSLFGGLKVAVNFAIIGAVVGELIGADQGLGQLTLTASTTLNTPLLLSALFSLSALGLASYGLVTLAERFAIPWRERRDLTGTVTA
jgi:NitT/TauT family transport system permease protein